MKVLSILEMYYSKRQVELWATILDYNDFMSYTDIANSNFSQNLYMTSKENLFVNEIINFDFGWIIRIKYYDSLKMIKWYKNNIEHEIKRNNKTAPCNSI